MTDYERGLRDGIERAAQLLDARNDYTPGTEKHLLLAGATKAIRTLAVELEPELRLNGRHGTTVDIDALIEKEREDPEFRKAYDALAAKECTYDCMYYRRQGHPCTCGAHGLEDVRTALEDLYEAAKTAMCPDCAEDGVDLGCPLTQELKRTLAQARKVLWP